MAQIQLHAEILSALVPAYRGYIVTHLGGVYGDKPAATRRFINRYMQLSATCRAYLAIENCENRYDVRDCLHVSKITSCPVIFDIFHHACTIKLHGAFPHEAAHYARLCSETWHVKTPKFHISEQKKGARLGAHASSVNNIPLYLKTMAQTRNICVMLQCKNKEVSALKLAE